LLLNIIYNLALDQLIPKRQVQV